MGTCTDVHSARLVTSRSIAVRPAGCETGTQATPSGKNSSVPGRLGGASMRTLAHQSVVCEVPTRFVISAYSNRVMVVVTQADNMGTLVSTAAKASARLAGR